MILKTQKRRKTMNSQRIIGNAIIANVLIFSFALCLTISAPVFAQTVGVADSPATLSSAQDGGSSYSADDLDNLLAPIALYPDPLLAQVLVAATFDDQIQDASQLLSAGGANVAIDDQPWDESVKAVAHYPKVLFTLAAQPDWTTALGQAYIAQSTDVMISIQRLRAMALAQGNLVSTSQQRLVATDGAIQILPTRAGYFFLPAYDPALAYSTPALVSFGPAMAIDSSSDDQIDWHEHHIFDRHHHYARTGDRDRRGRISQVRGRGRFNPGDRRGPETRPSLNRGQYNPGGNYGQANHGQTNRGKYNPAVNNGQANRGQYKPAVNNGQANRGQYKPAVNNGQTNRGQYNPAANHGQANRGQYNPGVNRGQMNYGQMNRGLVNTAMNRGAAARPSGRNRR
jgi:Protein of unknown function (DUF3300)